MKFVTDMCGEAYQFFLNTPWGENVENQFARNYTAFSSRFRFNGKEWDEKTGNFYYGARYYDPKISVWLSVDPLAHKYPSLSPYAFVANNPVMLVDPDGMRIVPTNGDANKTIRSLLNLYTDKTKRVNKLFDIDTDALENSNVYQTKGDFMDPKAFAKHAKKNGVAEGDIASAYQVYKAIAHRDDVEVTTITPSQDYTAGDGETGSRIGDDPNFQDPQTVNANYSDFIDAVKDQGGVVSQGLSDALFDRNEFNADVKGKGYVIFRDADFRNSANDATPLGHLLLDGSNTSNNGEVRALLGALLRFNLK